MSTLQRTRQAGSLALMALLLGAGCDRHFLNTCPDTDCGEQVTRRVDVSGFDEIEIRDAFRVDVRPSSEYRVTIAVPECLADRLDVRRDGSRLRIGAAGGCCGSGERSAVVELPVLGSIEARMASRVRLDGVTTSAALEVSASEASSVEGTVAANSVRIRLSSASSSGLSGSAGQLSLEVSEASRGSLEGLATRRADVSLRSASSATVRVSEHLDVSASGVSRLTYIGSPMLGRVELSGGSRIERQF